MNDQNKLIDISSLALELQLVNKKTGKTLTHTIRYWETQFKQVKPIKLAGNRRYYSKKQADKLRLIKYLLKDKKLSIEGAKNILKKKINTLDGYYSSSIKAEYMLNNLAIKTKKLIDKLKIIKKYGKKNSH